MCVRLLTTRICLSARPTRASTCEFSARYHALLPKICEARHLSAACAFTHHWRVCAPQPAPKHTHIRRASAHASLTTTSPQACTPGCAGHIYALPRTRTCTPMLRRRPESATSLTSSTRLSTMRNPVYEPPPPRACSCTLAHVRECPLLRLRARLCLNASVFASAWEDWSGDNPNSAAETLPTQIVEGYTSVGARERKFSFGDC